MFPIKTALITHPANRSNQKRKETRHLVIHETVSQADARRQLAYFNSGSRNANAHVFIDWNEILLTLPIDELGWHVGRNANAFTIGIELCRASNKADFEKQWAMATWLFAKLCKDYGHGADFILSHNEIRERYGGTDHTDPDEYFDMYGKTVDDFRADVAKLLKAPQAQPAMQKLDPIAARLAIALYGSLTKSSSPAVLTACNYAANSIRRAAGVPVETDLGKPNVKAADIVARASGMFWEATESEALRECFHVAAEALRAVK